MSHTCGNQLVTAKLLPIEDIYSKGRGRCRILEQRSVQGKGLAFSWENVFDHRKSVQRSGRLIVTKKKKIT